ncbi:MAG: acyl-CoA synthetase [Candidatus Rokubacteria bacterium]|nr:acyl-CoA synthetase [Candidatus Rokubacteria bacterium]
MTTSAPPRTTARSRRSAGRRTDILDDSLPPKELWPQRVYTLPEYQAYPGRLNSTEELIDRHVAEGRGDRPALLFEDQKVTYRALQASINKLGSALQALGIGPTDRVLLRAPSIPPALVANFAVLKIGAVIVPISPLFSRAEIVHIAKATEAVALIVAAAMLEEVDKARAELGSVRHVIVIGGDAAEVKAKGYLPYGELLARGGDALEAVRRGRMDVAVLLFTSGTTGMPKGTVHFIEEALIVPDTFGKYGWRVTPDDVIGGPAPLSLAAGYSTQAVIPFRFGAAVSLLPRFTPEGMFEQIQKHRITIVSILPTAYRKMMQVPDAARKYDLSSVRLCTGGGESLSAQTYEDWKRMFGLEIFEGLGTTEMMFVFVSSAVTRRVKPGAIGPAVPGYELRVVTEDGKDAKPGEVGLLIARGPTGTVYWRDPERQKAAVVGGWCRAGDFVTMDEDGYVWFLSREDDLIKSSGYRIGPEEIEEALCKHPAVADAGVIGVPDPVRGQNTRAYVVLRPGPVPSEPLKRELIESCREHIAVYKLPREIDFVAELPRAPGPAGPGTGKLLRRILRERARA